MAVSSTMEACPKLPMIHFDLKFSPDNGDFAHKMKQLIHVSDSLQTFSSGRLTLGDLIAI